MPYSWFNVTHTFGNAGGLSYVWTNGTNYHVPFVPGNYSVERITDYLQERMQAHGHYLLDPEGDPVFYLHLNVNNIYYAVTVTSTPIPTTLPISWKNPSDRHQPPHSNHRAQPTTCSAHPSEVRSR